MKMLINKLQEQKIWIIICSWWSVNCHKLSCF